MSSGARTDIRAFIKFSEIDVWCIWLGLGINPQIRCVGTNSNSFAHIAAAKCENVICRIVGDCEIQSVGHSYFCLAEHKNRGEFLVAVRRTWHILVAFMPSANISQRLCSCSAAHVAHPTYYRESSLRHYVLHRIELFTLCAIRTWLCECVGNDLVRMNPLPASCELRHYHHTHTLADTTHSAFAFEFTFTSFSPFCAVIRMPE